MGFVPAVRAQAPARQQGLVALTSHTALVAQGTVVHVLDLTSPSAPREARTLTLPAPVTALELAGTSAWIGLQRGGVVNYEFNAALQPVTSATLPAAGRVRALARHAGHLILAADALEVWSLASPPARLGSLALPPQGQVVLGPRVGWLLQARAQGAHLRLIDWTDPAAPRLQSDAAEVDWTQLTVLEATAAAAGPQGLALFALEDVRAPRLLAQTPGVAGYAALILTPRRMIAAGDRGLELYAHHPTTHTLRLRQRVPFGPAPVALALGGGRLAALDEAGVLHLFRYAEGIGPAPELEVLARVALGPQGAAEHDPAALRANIRKQLEQRQRHAKPALAPTTGPLLAVTPVPGHTR